MIKINHNKTYNGLVKLLRYHFHIDHKHDSIHGAIKPKNWINEMSYEGLVKLLSYHFCIDHKHDSIHVAIKPKNWVNEMSYDVKDDDDVTYNITFSQRWTNLFIYLYYLL